MGLRANQLSSTSAPASTGTREPYRAMRGRALSARLILRVALLLAALLPNGLLTNAAIAQDLTAHGDLEVTITRSGGAAALRGGPLDGGSLEKKDGAVVLMLNGTERARAVRDGSGRTELHNGSGAATYVLVPHGNGYLLEDPAKVAKFRVKIKEDKFNLYDPSDVRLMHGKQKTDGWGIKDEQGEQRLKLKGPQSLREASLLALPIEPENRVLLWAAEYL